ncbi:MULTISPECIES: copper-translocating P-type ATPase [Dietzia]|uniref:Copper-translocating P-type ATPase n=3 Tax=Dietzia TaxID=37914 RepID=A0A2A2WQ37_9ACTN|nr:copper-translocating P-type ATPase [Dietzia sp. Cai40]MBB1045915.1 copper-translocating P-type ATPase [Dietzia sp. DQ11-44]MBB1048109.1 copper-translocating P-type ATPase [Dietzia cercidiphylli]MBB1049666.1 copper-translocating P-type ATPase [Dietzia sp. CW19]MBB1054606.1 copper-translocating P-type ATPase [Dietzia sp. B44]MBB1056148.1 copper-translocating P-type ATPase [Dietzia sp. B19]PAY23281.1 copper-translocating P-type ATPase [Dietzia natronolimnaea]
MSHPEHGPAQPNPAPTRHGHGAEVHSPPPAEHGEHVAHVGPGGHGEDGGHDRHAGHGAHGEMFRRRFWASLVLAIPVVYFSHMVADLLGYTMPNFPGAMWIAPVLGTVIFLYGGTPFLTGGWAELRSRRPGMMLLISMAITVAFVASWITTLGLGGFELDFWWELALLIVIMLLGHWLEMRALGSASGALDALAAMLPDSAEKITDSGTVAVPLPDLELGDLVLVRAGARVPADGTVTDGRAEVDESMITGESKTVTREAGDTVVAGSVATDSALRVRITAVGESTALAGIQRMVADAQASSSRAQALADKAAAFLFYFATVVGILTFAVWALLGNVDEAVVRTVTVLVIACPHALGLAIPLVIAISTERAARSGVLVKDRLSLERMRTVDVVLFDKTGTLTEGQHRVTGVTAARGVTGERVLALAAAVEADSEHPVARAIVAAADDRVPAGERIAATDFRSLPGRGVRARVDGTEASVGGPAMLNELGLSIPTDVAEVTEQWVSRGASVLHVAEGDRILGAVALEDAVREESRQAIDALHARGVSVAMITGDAQQVADAVATDLGIDEVFAEVLPEHKDAKVTELQKRGHRVAMVGDGVNDAPALARADVGVAIGAGTDVAIESAGVVLAANDPRAVLSIIDLSHASYGKMWQNLVWATGYNVIAVPLAAGVLAFVGVAISPAVAAILMSVSTIVVALNAQLLRRLDLDPARLART